MITRTIDGIRAAITGGGFDLELATPTPECSNHDHPPAQQHECPRLGSLTASAVTAASAIQVIARCGSEGKDDALDERVGCYPGDINCETGTAGQKWIVGLVALNRTRACGIVQVGG